MASKAVRAHGTLLQRASGPGTYVTIAEQVNIEYTSSREEINISIHNEPDANTNWLSGPMATEVGFTANFLANDPTHDSVTGLLALYNTGGKDLFRILWATFTPVRFIDFYAFLKQFNIPAPAGEPAALQFTTTMRVDGQISWF